LVERNLAKVEVASSNLVSRSILSFAIHRVALKGKVLEMARHPGRFPLQSSSFNAIYTPPKKNRYPGLKTLILQASGTATHYALLFFQLDRQTVDAVAQPGRRRPIREYMAQVCTALFTGDFRANHTVAGIADLFDPIS
jgi:hypothetical protein